MQLDACDHGLCGLRISFSVCLCRFAWPVCDMKIDGVHLTLLGFARPRAVRSGLAFPPTYSLSSPHCRDGTAPAHDTPQRHGPLCWRASCWSIGVIRCPPVASCGWLVHSQGRMGELSLAWCEQQCARMGSHDARSSDMQSTNDTQEQHPIAQA